MTPRSDPDRPSPTSPTRGGRMGALALLAVVVTGCLAAAVTVVAVAVAILVRAGGAAPAPATTADAATVSATVDARASAAGYAVWDRDPSGAPVRWDPCRPIELVLAPAGAPASVDPAAFRRDVERAAATIAAASGLDLVVTGTTDARPTADRSTLSADGQRWAPVLVGWRQPREAGLPLRDTDRAIAVPVAARSGDVAGFVTGQIVLNADRDDLVPGDAERATSWGAVLLHELGHLVGLDHVDDPDQVMYREPGTGPVALGPGDRAGLAALGADAGCLALPPPADLEVTLPER